MKLIIKDDLKVKKYENPEFIVKILKKIRSEGLKIPKVISYNDSTITFEYINGSSLDKLKLTHELIDKAAELLARLNKIEIKGLKPKTKLLDRFNSQVDKFGYPDEYKKRFAKLRPKKIEFKLGHFDYKPSNLVFDGKDLWLIDFEGLCLGPIGVELSKAVYHFGKSFLKAYAKYGDISHYIKNREFYDLREQVSQASNKLP